MSCARAAQYELARDFAYPFRSATGALEYDVAALYARAVLDQVAGALESVVRTNAIEHLEGALAFSADLRVLGIAWCSALGECMDALRSSDGQRLMKALAAWCIESTVLGVPGSWHVTLGAEGALVLFDALLLPLGDSIAVDSDGANARIEVVRNGQAFHLEVARDELTGAWSGSGLERVVRADEGTDILLLPRHAVHVGDFPDLRPVMLDPIPSEAASRITVALGLLRAQDAGFHGWVARAFRYLFLVSSPERRLISGSLASKPRFGYISDADRAVATCEMLIHEASHQHFHLLSKVGPVTSGDEGQFYSPFVKTVRPLNRLLLAYHAFANVTLFYARAAGDGIDVEYCERSISRLLEEVDFVERTIDENAALLTPLGQGLFEPLKERLSDARAVAVH